MDRGAQPVFGGTRASYVALCSVAVLVLTTLQWAPADGGGAGGIAALGLLAVYSGSAECLTLFCALAPLSAFLDLWRLGGPREPHVRGRGLLIFLQLLGIAAKGAGALFAWSLQKSAAAGEGAGGNGGPGGGYHGGGAAGAGGAGGSMPPPPPGGYARVDDPFSLPPLPPAPQAPQQQQQQQQQPPPPQQQQQQQQQQQALPTSVGLAAGDRQQLNAQGNELI